MTSSTGGGVGTTRTIDGRLVKKGISKSAQTGVSPFKVSRSEPGVNISSPAGLPGCALRVLQSGQLVCLVHGALGQVVDGDLPCSAYQSFWPNLQHVPADVKPVMQEVQKKIAVDIKEASAGRNARRMRECSESWCVEVRKALAGNTRCPVSILTALSKEQACHWSLVHNKQCPAAILRDMFSGADDRLAELILTHPRCPADVIEAGCADDVPQVRAKAAQWPHLFSLPEETLQKLVNDRSLDVRCSVAAHSGCPVGVQKALLRSSNWAVRFSLLGNPHCSEDVIRALSADRAWQVRERVALLGGLPRGLRSVLREDEDPRVRRAARR